MSWRVRLYRVLPYPGRRQAEADLEEELRLHLELERERQRDAGPAEGAYTFAWTSPDGGRPWGAPVSPALLRLLGARPQLGRLFTDEEAQRGADGVVLLSHRAWTRRFDANPDVVGTLVQVGGERRTVVGVLAEGFYFPSPWEEVWTPFVVPPDAATVVVLGRLRPGVSAMQATTEVRAILQRMGGAGARPSGGDANGGTAGDAGQYRVRTIPLQEEMVGEYRPALAALTAAAALAAFGVYGLLSYNVAQRRGEIAIRMALGAQRGDVLALVVGQGAALVAAGTIVGVAAAASSSRILESFLYGIATDDVVTFAAAPVALVVAGLFACYVPARRATRIGPMEVLRFE